MPDSALRDLTVVVTGASAGVGRAVALRFAKAGARLGLIARDQEALERVADQVRAQGATACPVAADVADAVALSDAAARIERELGAADVWVNDAMATVFSPVADMTPEEFRRVTEVTYLGFVHATMAALRQMRPRGRGTIVQVGSALAYRGIPLQSAYCGAKHAIRGFTDSLRTELLHEGSKIRLSMVQLPAMNTPQFSWARTHMPRQPRPMGTIYQPEVAAEAVFRAAHHQPREVWLGGSTLMVILGNMLAPGALDRYLAWTAYGGQEGKEPVRPGRKDNLFEPVAAFHRTHGAFDGVARDRAVLLQGWHARLGIALVASAAMAATAIAVSATRPRPKPAVIVQRRSGQRAEPGVPEPWV